MHDYVKILRR